MIHAYRSHAFTVKSRERIDFVNTQVIEPFFVQRDIQLTLRQIHYQLVMLNATPMRQRIWPYLNDGPSYKNLSTLLTNARMAGLVDWDAIVDRLRQPVMPGEFENLRELVDAALASYRLPRWRGQRWYAELWTEKDALAGTLLPLVQEMHVPFVIDRGFTSTSAVRESTDRLLRAHALGKQCIIYYLGDHDPSGLCMIEHDIPNRLAEFGVTSVEVRHLGLTMAQITAGSLPWITASFKKSANGSYKDSRAAAYVARFGEQAWEVDALRPDVLQTTVREAFDQVIDDRQLRLSDTTVPLTDG